MRLQSDQKVRVVALDNLRAMCARVSGTAHRFSVVKVSRSRVHVEYSNPDEWGREHPFVAVFPCYPSSERNEDRDNPCVVLSMMRTIGEPSDYGGEGWQAFAPVLDCPTLRRAAALRRRRPVRAPGRRPERLPPRSP